MAKQQDSAHRLLRLYNEVDLFMRQLGYQSDQLGDITRSIPHQVLIDKLSSKNRVIFQYQHEMRTVAQLRNCLVHNPFNHFDGPIITPNPELVKRYKIIRDALVSPKTALSIAIPANKIYTAALESNLVNVLRCMSENTYTHVPILEKDKLVGILSENTLLSYIADTGNGIITDDMTVADLDKYIPLKSHISEVFVFLPRDAELAKVFEVFKNAVNKLERIGMLFVTQTGKESEKPLGIITAWDLASSDFELS